MIERTGNLWDSTAKAFGHGVNVEGLMGAGIAVQFRDKFPKNYTDYKAECKSGLMPGSLCGMHEQGLIILNFASQDLPGAHARYDWLFSSLYKGAKWLSENEKYIKTNGNIIAIPEIGCGIGGLKWKAVAKVILAVEAAVDNKVEFEVWHYDG